MLAKTLFLSILLCFGIFTSGQAGGLKDLDNGVDPIDEPVVDYLYMVIANIQSLLANGLPEAGVAPLDPSTLGSYHLPVFGNGSATITEASADILDLDLSGISNFAVDELDFHVISLSGKLQLSWPQLVVNGNYSAQGQVSGVASVATGHINISLRDITINSTLAFGFNETALIIKNFELELLMGLLTVELSNLDGSVELQDELQRSLTDMTTTIFDSIAARLGVFGNDAQDILNEPLSQLGDLDPTSLLGELYVVKQRIMSKLGLSI